MKILLIFASLIWTLNATAYINYNCYLKNKEGKTLYYDEQPLRQVGPGGSVGMINLYGSIQPNEKFDFISDVSITVNVPLNKLKIEMWSQVFLRSKQVIIYGHPIIKHINPLDEINEKSVLLWILFSSNNEEHLYYIECNLKSGFGYMENS